MKNSLEKRIAEMETLSQKAREEASDFIYNRVATHICKIYLETNTIADPDERRAAFAAKVDEFKDTWVEEFEGKKAIDTVEMVNDMNIIREWSSKSK
ncbi:hypothetical protein ACFLS8_01115 [Chloroflexota bacterium]